MKNNYIILDDGNKYFYDDIELVEDEIRLYFYNEKNINNIKCSKILFTPNIIDGKENFIKLKNSFFVSKENDEKIYYVSLRSIILESEWFPIPDENALTIYTKLEDLECEDVLKEIKQLKIDNLSKHCAKAITDGLDIDGEHFSYAEEDQSNIKRLFDLAVQANMPLPYHCDGGNCRLYSADEIKRLYILQDTNMTKNITYFNQLRGYVEELASIDDICNVYYGQPLEGKYLENYENLMEQVNSVINVFTGGNN